MGSEERKSKELDALETCDRNMTHRGPLDPTAAEISSRDLHGTGSASSKMEEKGPRDHPGPIGREW